MAVPDRSPCLVCERLQEDKNYCARDCEKLNAFHDAKKTDRSIDHSIDKPAPKEMKTVVKLSVAEAERALGKERVAEIIQSPGTSQPVKYCKNHLETPEHKKTGLCLVCLQERGRRNAAASRKVPLKLALEPGEILNFADPALAIKTALLAKFPDLDPAGGPDLKAKWFDGFKQLLDLLRR